METLTKQKNVFQLQFKQYVMAVQSKHQNKRLSNAQVRFLRYPFITSVFWAKNQHKAVKKANMELYYNTVFQLSINF